MLKHTFVSQPIVTTAFYWWAAVDTLIICQSAFLVVLQLQLQTVVQRVPHQRTYLTSDGSMSVFKSYDIDISKLLAGYCHFGLVSVACRVSVCPLSAL